MDNTAALIQEYLTLTREVMPQLAQQLNRAQGHKSVTKWPVEQDHSFQRILLDTICEGVWYDSIKSPAYKHLNETQATAAVQLCKRIINGQEDLKQLNEDSLKWRQKQHTFSF